MQRRQHGDHTGEYDDHTKLLDRRYLASREAPIKPLIEPLTFIRNKTHWGAAFRFGFVRVPEADFARIAEAMGREFARDFPL